MHLLEARDFSRVRLHYHCNGSEIDYVSSSGKAIEISVSNKLARDLSFDVLPYGYEKILLTKDRVDSNDGILRIPYYQFICDHSEGKELAEQLTIQKN